jgi:hypothetical protein
MERRDFAMMLEFLVESSLAVQPSMVEVNLYESICRCLWSAISGSCVSERDIDELIAGGGHVTSHDVSVTLKDRLTQWRLSSWYLLLVTDFDANIRDCLLNKWVGDVSWIVDGACRLKVVEVAILGHSLMVNVVALYRHVVARGNGHTHGQSQAQKWLCAESIRILTDRLEVWLIQENPDDNDDHINELLTILTDILLLSADREIELVSSQTFVNNIINFLYTNLSKISQELVTSKPVDIIKWYDCVHLLHSIHLKLKEGSSESLELSQLMQYAWQTLCTTIECVSTYHTQICTSILLQNNTTDYQRPHVDFTLQMWNFYLNSIRHDMMCNHPTPSHPALSHPTPSHPATIIFTTVVNKTLKLLSSQVINKSHSINSLMDITTLLLIVSQHLPTITHPLTDNSCELNEIIAYCRCLAGHLSSTGSVDENWQDCLPLVEFGIPSVHSHGEKMDELISRLCHLPYTCHQLILKIIMSDNDGLIKKQMVNVSPPLFTSLADILIHCDQLDRLFTQCNVDIFEVDEVSKTAVQWLKENLCDTIIRLLTDAAVEYAVTSITGTNDDITNEIILKFFKSFTAAVIDIDHQIATVLNHYMTTCTDDGSVSSKFAPIQLVFGQIFNDVVSIPSALISSDNALITHWNKFTDIILAFFPPVNQVNQLLMDQHMSHEVVTTIQSLMATLQDDFTLKYSHHNSLGSPHPSECCHLDYMILADSINLHPCGRKAFITIDNWIKHNKDGLLSLVTSSANGVESIPTHPLSLSASPIDQFDPVAACNRLGSKGNFKMILDLFNRTS